MTKNNNKGVYIQSIEAAQIWEHINRGTELKTDYIGAIPYSLELKKLRKEGLIELVKKKEGYVTADARTIKNADKVYSNDIVNVKFGQSVKDADGTIKAIEKSRQKKIIKLQAQYRNSSDDESQNELNEKIDKINNHDTYNHIRALAKDNPEVWDRKLNVKELRHELYVNGFTLNGIEYCRYKRSSAKSRVGECLFIRKELYHVMMHWSHMGLDFAKAGKIDISGLSAYESLTGSAIEGEIKIHPKNILLIDDIESVFKWKANVIQTTINQDGQKILCSRLDENAEVKNNLFDGQGLLESSYYTGKYEGKSMILTRQHFFKSCMFSTNIQLFMRDQFKDEYETATVEDMLGNKIKVKDIHCIITPSSLKCLKFSSVIDTEKDMYKHWANLVKEEKCIFGVCKTEKPTKRGMLNGMPLQRLSYQMINSLPGKKGQIEELASFEIEYINKMKSDVDTFIKHLQMTSNFTNANQMMIDLYCHNADFAKTELFNNFKIQTINQYILNVKKGKLRVLGSDYCTIIGNPYEMLLHSIGKLDIHNLKSHSLQGAEVCTPLFEDGEALTGFRNPHSSANNILKVTNKHDVHIDKYFKLTKNTVAVNLIDFPLQDILSGSDQDGDTVLLSNDKTLHTITKNVNDTYYICLNKVTDTKNTYELTNDNFATVDYSIASDLIGKIVNICQIAQSIYYDSGQVNEEMKEVIEIISVASGIAIDMAKRQYEIDIEKELIRLTNLVNNHKKALLIDEKETSCNPSFMKFTSDKKNTVTYNTPMDYVVELFKTDSKDGGKLNRANELKSEDIIEMFSLIKRCDENGEIFEVAKANDKQEKDIIRLVNNYSNNIKAYRVSMNGAGDAVRNQMIKAICDESLNLHNTMQKKKIEPVTIYAILYHLFNKKSISDGAIKVLNAIYSSNENRFMNAFLTKKVEEIHNLS